MARLVIALVMLWALTFALQARSGSFGRELSHSDEAAHFITGLMIHDYVTSGLHAWPMAFAVNYYAHYPKVAFGIWPPLFHIVEATWMLAAPATPESALVLVGLIIGLLATALYAASRAEFGDGGAFLVAILFLLLPGTRFCASRLLADAQVALFAFFAVVSWGRYLDREEWQASLLFGVFGSLTMLTKGNGNALFVLPVVAALLAGRVRLLARPASWVGPLVMILVGMPWQWYSWRILRSTVSLQWSFWHHFRAYCVALPVEAGPVVFGFALIGLAAVLWQIRSGGGLTGWWASIVALPVAFVLFHSFAPLPPSGRYLLPALPSIAILAGAGVTSLARLAPFRRWFTARSVSIALAGCLAAGCLPGALSVQRTSHYGYAEIARTLLARITQPGAVVLSSSRGEGDGMLISEIASRERRPRTYVLRADKMLASSDWDGRHYRLRYTRPSDVERFLQSVPVDFIVIDLASSRFADPHQALLIDAIHRYHAQWRLIERYPRDPAVAPRLVAYEAAAGVHDHHGRIEINMKYSLGRTIVVK